MPLRGTRHTATTSARRMKFEKQVKPIVVKELGNRHALWQEPVDLVSAQAVRTKVQSDVSFFEVMAEQIRAVLLLNVFFGYFGPLNRLARYILHILRRKFNLFDRL